MTDDERFSLLVGVMGAGELWPLRDERIPPGIPMSAGYVPGVPRLGVPALLMSDAGLGRDQPRLPAGRHRHRAAGRAGAGRQLQPGAGPLRGRGDRPRGAQPRVQRAAGRRDEPGARPAQRPQLRIPFRGPAFERHDGRRVDQRDTATGRHLDGQALLTELQRDQPALAGRGHRSRRASRIGLAGLRDRHRALAARRRDDGLQQGQRRLRRRQTPS